MAINKKLIHFKNKQKFNEELANGNILETSIVFIQDTQEIYTHGTFYDGKQVDLSNIESSIQNILKNKQDIINDLDTIRSGAALGATALQSETYKGTITGVSANGTSVATSGVANISAASTSAYGVTKLSSSTSSTSTTLAATASAVKSAYDLANGKQAKLVSGTNIKTINGESILGEGNLTVTTTANIQAVDTTDEIEDVETNTYVKYVAQTLTDEQKAQVRENIGALSTSDQVTVDLSNYYTKEEINTQLGDINTILESIINGGGVKMINFTVQGTEYQAEEGMTWERWINSSYNTINAQVDDTFIYAGDIAHSLRIWVSYDSGNLVQCDELIIRDHNYELSD